MDDRTTVVTFRVRPHVLHSLQAELGLPQGTGPAVTMRAAIERLTGVAPSEMADRHGGPRPNSGRKPKRRPEGEVAA